MSFDLGIFPRPPEEPERVELADPLRAFVPAQFWPTWPDRWSRNMAYQLVTKGEKGISQVLNNLSKMRKRIDNGQRQRTQILSRVDELVRAQ